MIYRIENARSCLLYTSGLGKQTVAISLNHPYDVQSFTKADAVVEMCIRDRAIYEAMRQDPRFEGYRFIWFIKKHKQKQITIPGAEVKEYFSFSYFYYICLLYTSFPR